MRWKRVLHYPNGSSVITGTPKIGDSSLAVARRRCAHGSVVREMQQLEALKTEAWTTSQRNQEAYRSQKRQGNGFSPTASRKVPPSFCKRSCPSLRKQACQALCEAQQKNTEMVFVLSEAVVSAGQTVVGFGVPICGIQQRALAGAGESQGSRTMVAGREGSKAAIGTRSKT